MREKMEVKRRIMMEWERDKGDEGMGMEEKMGGEERSQWIDEGRRGE